VDISPNVVTVETNQLVQFIARGTTLDGDTILPRVEWSASGGTILADGRFSATAAGTVTIVATTPGFDEDRIDTAVVEVVRRQPLLQSIVISPGTSTLSPGIAQTFVVTGYLKDGRAVPVGANWTATGGSIDAGGNYIAGDTAGTYQVIATRSLGAFADTAEITIGAPTPPPPPPPAPTPPPAPVLVKVMLVPGTATLAPAATRQFSAYGLVAGGDSVAADVVFTSTGGTVTTGGLFTAGSTPGTYRVIATAGALADTSAVTVTQPLGSGPASGLPFGAYRLLLSGVPTGPLTMSAEMNFPSTIVNWIADARQKGVRIMLVMTGGAHKLSDPGCCMSVINGVLQFDRAKWEAKLQTFNTPAIRDAVAKGVADGTIIGATVMDEPYVIGGADGGGNTWGPPGTMTKARVDSLCSELKQIFPTLPAGAEHQHDKFEPTKSYRVCDFIVDQYDHRRGDITAFRDAGVAMAARDGHAVLFSLNVLDGGVQDKDGTWDCSGTGQAGRGTFAPNCRMTPDQVRNWGLKLGPAGCGLFMWRTDGTYMQKPENQQAFAEIADLLKRTPAKSCRRS
jgi:hypothetical protein